MPSAESKTPLDWLSDLTKLRSHILDQFILVNALTLSLTLALAVYKTVQIGVHWSLPVTAGGACVMWGLWLLRNRIPYRARAWWLLACCWALVLGSVLNLGPVANSKGYFILITLAATIFLGPRIGWLNVAAVGVALSGIGTAAVMGWVSFQLDYEVYVRLPVVWIQNTFGYTVFSASSALIAAHFLDSLTSAAHDLAQRTQALIATEARLRFVLRRQRAIYHTSAVGIAMLDGKHRFSDVNTRFAHLLGWHRGELLGRHSRFIHADAAVDALLRDRLATGRRKSSMDCQVRRCDGTLIWCQLSLSLLDPERMTAGAVMVLVDIDKRVRFQAELLSARLAADRAIRAKDQFLAMVSHDLRTPLHALLGFAELLSNGGGCTATQVDLVQGIRRNGSSLLYLVEEILEFSRGESGKRRIRAEPCALGPVLQRALSLIEHQARTKGLELRLELPDALPGLVLIDPERLLQIIGNLLNNALKFTDRGYVGLSAAVRRAATDPGRCELIIVVADSGRGIGADDQARIFEPFERIDPGREQSGAGLGLAICRQLVRAMGGQIAVDSRLGDGSRFRVQFPRLPIITATQSPAPAGSGDRSAAADAMPPLPLGALPSPPPALAVHLLVTAARRWQALTPGMEPSAVADFVAEMAGVARTHAYQPLACWAEGLSEFMQGTDAGKIPAWWQEFAQFILEPPPRAALRDLRTLAGLGMISHIERWCRLWGERDPRYAGFVRAVLAAAHTFKTARLIELVDAFAGVAPEDAAP